MTIWNVSSESSLRDAITQSAAGDTIAVQAGDYHIDMHPRGRYDIQITKSLNIVGDGGRANFFSDGHQVEKGIFNLALSADETVSFNNIGFLNAHNGDMNGAGIRQNGGNLNVNNSYFDNSDNGILSITHDRADRGDVRVTNSEFNRAGSDGYSHAMYVLANKFTVEGNYIHDTVRGHHVKSLSAITVVRNNIIDDGDGTSSYAVDVGAGGNVLIEGNRIIQGLNGENPGIIAYSSDRFGGAAGNVVIRENDITNLRPESYASLVDNMTDAEIKVSNNVIKGFTSDQLFDGLFRQQGNVLDGVALPSFSTNHLATLGTAGDDVMNIARVRRGSPLPLDAGDGNDTVSGSTVANLLFGGDGNDVVFGGGGKDYIYGQNGNDILLGGADDDHVFGQNGNDIIFDVDKTNLLWGGDGHDLIFGTGTINGNAGNDFVISFGDIGKVRLSGGNGDDILFGRDGEDMIDGGAGVDIAVYSGARATYAVTESYGVYSIDNIAAADAVSDTGNKHESIESIEKLQFSDGYLDIATDTFYAGQYLFNFPAYMQAVNDLDTIAASTAAPLDMVPMLQGIYAAFFDLN